MVVRHPAAQAVEHEVTHCRIVAVERVSAPGEVVVIALRREHIIGPVINAPERDRGAAFVTLRGVVEDDIQNHLDAVAVQFFDEGLEFVDGKSHFARGGEPGFGAQKATVL